MARKPSYPRKKALHPIKKRAGQTSDEDRALKDKAIGRGLQRKMENGPRKGTETSETVWAHLNPRDDNIYLDELDMRDEVLTRPEPSEELEPVSLDEDPEHLAYIGSKLAEDLKSLLTHFLRQNKDVFAWK